MSNNKIELSYGHGCLEKKLKTIVCESLRYKAEDLTKYKYPKMHTKLVFPEFGIMLDVFDVREYDQFGTEIYYEVEVWDDLTPEEKTSLPKVLYIEKLNKDKEFPYSFSKSCKTSFVLSSNNYELNWFLVVCNPGVRARET